MLRFLIFTVSLFFVNIVALAEEFIVPLEINSPEATLSNNLAYYGLILSPNSFKKVPAKNTVRISDKNIHVIFDVAPEELGNPNVKISAMAEFVLNQGLPNEKRKSFYGDIGAPKVFPVNENICKFKTSIAKQLTNSDSYVASLIEVRAAQKDILHQRFTVRLTEAKINHLLGLEKLFGLGTGEPLDPNGNIFELQQRIFRLRNALKNSVSAELNG
jgi:hypothetical protein